jgi:hypothetical protein
VIVPSVFSNIFAIVLYKTNGLLVVQLALSTNQSIMLIR